MIIPILPLILFLPITPSDTEDRKIATKNHKEFHHFAFGAEKQTTNHNSPAMDNIMLAIPNGFVFCTRAELFTSRFWILCRYLYLFAP
jgi:hypothetical protein